MTDVNAQFTGSIPEVYDKYLGPILFEFSAKDLAERVADKIPSTGKILEIASGTGISTKYLHDAVPDTIQITASDLNADMLDYAQNRLGDKSNISFQVENALELSLGDDIFDAVVCQFGIMFFPDKLAGLNEMWRVLKPGGTLAFNVWDSFENNRAAGISHKAVTSFFNSDPPQFLKAPFGYFDVDHINNLMTQAGFENIENHTVNKTHHGLKAMDVATGFVTGNPTVIEIQNRASVSADTVIRAAAKALNTELGQDPMDCSFKEFVFIATKN